MIDATTNERDLTIHQRELHAESNLRLLLASALVEHVDPMVFGRQLVDDAFYEQALIVLSESCDEVEHDGQWYWVLRRDIRRDLLVQHYGSELFESVRAQVVSLSSDAFAHYLKKGMNGQRLSTTMNTVSDSVIDFNALLKAARLIDLLCIPAQDGSVRGKDHGSGEIPSEARQIRRYIEKKSATDNLGIASSERLFGRYRDVRTLIKFRNANLVDPRNHALRLCVVIGVGGIGKSALLARYIAWQRNCPKRAPVIHFDFDRSSLNPSDPLALTFEFTRQLGLYVPDLDLLLVRYRRSLRTPEALEEADMFPDRSLTNALAILGEVLADWPGRTSGITLVIDTFEEVVLQGNHAVKKSLAWLTYLRNLAHLDNLHIIIAGREMPDSILSDHRPHIHCRIRLSDLHRGAAKLMLQHLGVSSLIADKAVNAFGGNPLVLRMFVRFYEDKPEEIEALLADSRNHRRSAPIGKLAITFLFERILARINNEQIRKITNPGLLLRHITADLIKNVLAQACNLGPLTDEQSQSLFFQLAEHVWLVRQEGDRLLSHRRDLRRMMLPGIQMANESTFEQINRLAVQYYTSQPDGVSSEEAWIEAAYHRGFLAEDPIPHNARDARKLITLLGSDLMDWPVHTIALIKQAALPGSLTALEKRSLEAEHGLLSRASLATHLEEPALLANYNTADKGVNANNNAHDELLPYTDTLLANTECIRQYFKDGRFDHISPLAAPLLDPLFKRHDALAVTHYWQDENLLHKEQWLAALSILAEPNYESDDAPIIPSAALDAVQSSPRRVSLETTFELFYMLAIAQLMQDRQAITSLSCYLKSHLPCFAPPIEHAAQLQILQISIKAIESGHLIGNRDIITVANCDMLQWRSLYQALSDDTHPDTNANRHRQENIRSLLPEADSSPSLEQLNMIRTALKVHSVEVLGPAGLDKLKCVQPVLYDPICFALESVPAQRIFNALKSISYEQSQWWPADLTPSDAFTSQRKTVDPRTLRLIVDTADRCNLLEEFLTTVSIGQEDPLIHDELRILTRLRLYLTGDN